MSTYHVVEPMAPPRSEKNVGYATGIPRWVAAAVVVGALLTLAGAVISKLAPTRYCSRTAIR